MSALAPLLGAKRTSPFLKAGGTAAEYRAGIAPKAGSPGTSGTYLRFTEAGAALFVVRWGRPMR
jgi:hypothetical protein